VNLVINDPDFAKIQLMSRGVPLSGKITAQLMPEISPVEQSMVETTIVYQLEAAKGASPQFVKKYRAVYPMIAAKNLTEAGPLMQEIEKGDLNYYAQAWLWWLKYL